MSQSSAGREQSSAHGAPIRKGDRFTDSRGDVWKVIETKPFGRCKLMSESGRLRFCSSYTRDVRRNFSRAE